MDGAAAALYEPLIERDLPAIPAALRRFRESRSSHDLFLAIARFAVLAYAPSSHSKHALLACLSAWDVREEAAERFDDLLEQCARYAAESRRPWSEPPLLDPPAVDVAPAGMPELRAAIEARDARAAEAWLARRHQDDDVIADLLALACEFPGELGHSIIVTNAVARLSKVLGEKGRYAILRVAVWELLAAEPDTPGRAGEALADDELLTALIRRAVVERGSIESLHGVFLFDAALEAGVLGKVRPLLSCSSPGAPDLSSGSARQLPVYALARDFGACLKAHAVAARLRHPAIRAFVEAAHRNLQEGESFAEWSLA